VILVQEIYCHYKMEEVWTTKNIEQISYVLVPCHRCRVLSRLRISCAYISATTLAHSYLWHTFIHNKVYNSFSVTAHNFGSAAWTR